MKIEEIKSKTDSELEYELEKMERELFDMRFRAATDSAQSPAKIRLFRRSIARIKTVTHERRLGIRGQEAH
jgi:large subunit ribosomal protein L29